MTLFGLELKAFVVGFCVGGIVCTALMMLVRS